MNVEELNKQLKKEFYENKNYQTLEKYVMSELLSPIQDYDNATKIIRENIDLLENLDLLYIATYLSSEYLFEENEFLKLLDQKIELVSNKDKAMIYFLKANDLICSDKKWQKNDKCKEYLQKSVELSKGFKFANNRFYLAQCLGNNASVIAHETLNNIINIENIETLQQKKKEYWLSSVRFIDEFILGISINNVVYEQKEQSLSKLGLL